MKIKSKVFLNYALNNAVAQQRFEGLIVSKSVICDLKKVINGKLSIEDVIKNIENKLKK